MQVYVHEQGAVVRKRGGLLQITKGINGLPETFLCVAQLSFYQIELLFNFFKLVSKLFFHNFRIIPFFLSC